LKDSGSEQSTKNEASTVASISKYYTILGSTLRLRGAQLGRVGRDARAIASEYTDRSNDFSRLLNILPCKMYP
jgi:hypothetical protein